MNKTLLMRALRAIATAYTRRNACNQNCNQGRCCTYRQNHLDTKQP